MELFLHENIKGGAFPPALPLTAPASLAAAASPPPPAVSKYENGISPSILLIIVILAVIFFISGLLHLFVRYLLRHQSRDSEDMDNATALQGQLQQLFHLHDDGVDQTFIDSLPVFLYKAIVGVKDPFDCAVCLCEFEADDKLRLLPKCSHAFHLDCIDTWLLSHSTCPLCRRSLLPDLSPSRSFSPYFFVQESGSESSREIASERGDHMPSSHLGYVGEDDFNDTFRKSLDVAAKEEISVPVSELAEAKVVSVKLGKFRSVEGREGGEGTSNDDNTLDKRRCFSMGSYEYVMDESSLLHVAIKPLKKKPIFKKPGHGLAVSEYDGHSRREGFRGFDAPRSMEFSKVDAGNASIGSSRLHKKESFSVSKTWLRSKKQKTIAEDLSRRAFSFRLPLHHASSYDSKPKRSISPVTVSELHASRWEKSGIEVDLDIEAGSCGNGVLSRADEAPSFARRTMLWIAGLHNRVGNHF